MAQGLGNNFPQNNLDQDGEGARGGERQALPSQEASDPGEGGAAYSGTRDFISCHFHSTCFLFYV